MQVRSRKAATDDQRERAVDKGWSLVKNYRKENPERHLVEGPTGLVEQVKKPEVPPLLRGEMLAYQEETLTWLGLGMASWLNFYFAPGNGNREDRLKEAADGLRSASERLDDVSEQIARLPGVDKEWGMTVHGYREAIRTWSSAMDLIARGVLFDNDPLAREGINLLERASVKAELVMDVDSGPSRGVNILAHLRALERIEPSDRMTQRAVEDARKPWRRALNAAGSKLDWYPNQS